MRNVLLQNRKLIEWTTASLLLLLAAWVLRPAADSSNDAVPVTEIRSPNELWQRVEQHLSAAEERAAQARSASIEPVSNYFTSIRQSERVKLFAQEVLGYSGKWQYLTMSEAEFQAWIQRQFEQHVFVRQDIEQLAVNALAQYQQQLTHLDNELLVAIQSDLVAIQSAQPLSELPLADLQTRIQNLLNTTQVAASADIGPAIAREIASYVIGEVIAQVTTQALVSGGVLSAGAASGTVTLGVTLVVGIVVDAGIQAITDPAQKLADQLNLSLQEIETTTVNQLEQSLVELAKRQVTARRENLSSALGVAP
jgi:hypothetical protein